MSHVNVFVLCRRSCVGSELVDWLLEHCPFVQCRSTAIGVWQLLLDMGILSSGQQGMFGRHKIIILLSGQTKIYLLSQLPGWIFVLQINICTLSYFINKSDRSSFDCYFSHTFCKNNQVPADSQTSAYKSCSRTPPSLLYSKCCSQFFLISDIFSCPKCVIYLAVLRIIIRD